MGKLRNLREVVDSLKHGHSAPKFCPRCGNPKIRLSTSFDGWLFPAQYVCHQCGYKGPIVLELEAEPGRMEKEAEEDQSGSSKPS